MPQRDRRVRQAGILGGTFDPPHIGHLVAADQALHQLGLDEVRLVVTNHPWQKVGSRRITSPERRLELVRAAASIAPGVEASSIELELGGPSYTMATLEALTEREPGIEWQVIVGADAAAGLDTWHRADELRAVGRFVVVTRPGRHGEVPPGWQWQPVEIPAIDVSSSQLRGLVAGGRSVRHLTPEPVVQLLASWGLYRQGA